MFLRSIFAVVAALAVHGEPLKVVCFGDSTTAPRQGVVTYCESLAKEYSVENRVSVTNRGVPGNTTSDARARFVRDVSSARPNLVLIQFGINDSTVDVWKTPPRNQPRVSLDEYRDNLRYFVDNLHTAGAKVVLMTFNPMEWTPKLKELYGKSPYNPEEADGFEAGRKEYLTCIREVALEKHVELIDVNGAFLAYAAAPGHTLRDLLLDGIHPNSLGHSITTTLARPVVQAAIDQRGQ